MNTINKTNRQNYISKQDLFYDKPVRNSWDGLPIGNGVTGTVVWTRGTAVYMQFNRVDLFATNSSTTATDFDMVSPGFYGIHEYRGGLGTLIIDMGVDTAPGGICLQRLSFYHGTACLESETFKAEIFMAADCDLLCARVRRKVPCDKPITIAVEALREAHIVRQNHHAHTWFEKHDGCPVLRQRFEEKADNGFTENDHYMESALIPEFCTVEGVGLPVDVATNFFPGKERLYNNDYDYRAILDNLLRYRARLEQRVFTLEADVRELVLYTVTAVSDDRHINPAEKAGAVLKEGIKRGYREIKASHRSWWGDFWDRSYVLFKDYPLFDRYFVTNLYYMGSCMRGAYPAQYNGLLWNTQGDLAHWGGQYWWYNTGRNFYCLDKLGHGELAMPLFKKLVRNIPRYTQASRQQWKGDGIYFPETDAFNGPERLPDHIAEQLHVLLVQGKPPGSDFLNYIKNRSGMVSRWALFLNKEEQKRGIVNNFGWHSNLVYNAGDVANIMWEHYLHTRDKTFLEDYAYPWMEGVVLFYITFPGLVKEEDGKYHLHHTGWAESIASARDVIDDLVVIRGLFPTVIKAARILNKEIPFEDRMLDVLENLAPYPDNEMADAISPNRHPEGHPTYAMAREPVRGHASNGCSNDCRLRMTFLFDLVNLENRETQPEIWERTMRSLEAFSNVKEIMNDAHPTHGNWGYVWNRTVLKTARMGRTDLVEKGLPTLLRQFTMPNHYGQHKKIWQWPNRMPWTNEVQSSSIQETGALCDCLQEPLMQCISAETGGEDSVIHLFPAWPKKWDAEFQLHSRDDFDVYAGQQDGEITGVVIDSLGGLTCRVRNPWKGKRVILTDREMGEECILTGDLLVFPTRKGNTYRLCREGDNTEVAFLEDCKPVFLFDQVSVQLPFYDGVPTVAPGEETAAVLSLPVDGVVFTCDDNQTAEVNAKTWHGRTFALIKGIRVGDTGIRAKVNGRTVAEAEIRVRHKMVNDYDPDIVYGGDWEGWWYTICDDGFRREHLLYGKSGRENNPPDLVQEAGGYFLDPDSMNLPRPWYDDYHYTSEASAYFEYAFTGTGVEIIGLGCPEGGEAEVFIDNTFVGVISCKNPKKVYQYVLYRKEDLNYGNHSLRVVVKNGVFYLDAVRIL